MARWIATRREARFHRANRREGSATLIAVNDIDIRGTLRALDRPFGETRRRLRIGRSGLSLQGLSDEWQQLLARRWGGFLEPASDSRSDMRVRLMRWGGEGRLELTPGELYRIEALDDGVPPTVVSYNFAVCPDDSPNHWIAAIRDDADEPAGRILDNIARFLTARIAVDIGGFAMHAAGVLREGRAFLFAGASNAGKTTAVGLSEPCRSLGDDMALVYPGDGGWVTPALPFDNSECASNQPPRGEFAVEGIWRLHQAAEHSVERLATGRAIASLMGCSALPWALPDLSNRLLDQVSGFVLEGRFAHLHFRRDSGFWTLLLQGSR